MRDLLAIQEAQDILLLPDLMLPIIRISVRAVPGFDNSYCRIKLANPVRPDMQRNRHNLRVIDDYDQLIDLLQGGVEHELMPFMQRSELPQRQSQRSHARTSLTPLFQV
ncbi:hypothetical protein D3C72_2022590 [compost metagenome]